MKNLEFGRITLSSCVAAAMLAGCGGSQPPIGAPGAVPQAPASTGYTSLYSFGKRLSDGQQPKAGLIDVKGTLYGTTYAGGKYGDGTVFRMSPSGTEKLLHSFEGTPDGSNPSASLLSVAGDLYGTTKNGGAQSVGTVFSISRNGNEKVLYSFYGYYYHEQYYYDGSNPTASLIDVKGTLYGTTSNGGSDEFSGTVFSISTSGTEKVLQLLVLPR